MHSREYMFFQAHISLDYAGVLLYSDDRGTDPVDIQYGAQCRPVCNFAWNGSKIDPENLTKGHKTSSDKCPFEEIIKPMSPGVLRNSCILGKCASSDEFARC